MVEVIHLAQNVIKYMKHINSYKVFESLLIIEEVKKLSNREEKIGALLHLYGSIPLSKEKASVVISKIIRNSRKEGFFSLYDTTNVIIPWNKLHDKLRFYDYFDSLLSSKDIRGHNFEGLVAGLFGGELTQRGSRSDVKIGDTSWSVKFLNSASESPVLGSVKSSLSKRLQSRIENEYRSIYDLFVGDDNRLKTSVFNSAFAGVTGFIIAYPNEKNTEIHLHVVPFEKMREVVCNGGVARPKNKGDFWSLRVNTKYKMDDPMVISIPKISDAEVSQLLNVPNQKWADIVFGSEISRKIRPDVIQDIMINSEDISNRMKKFKDMI
jgi:hypothetical protein